jgi:hypothetical protein
MRQRWAYIISTILVVLMSLITGIGNLIPFSHIESDLIHLGYPPYFRIILGTWKVIAAIVIMIPRKLWFKDLAYMGILLDLSGAAASRWAVGDGAVKVILPLIISVWVAVSWWHFRKRLHYFSP